MTAPGAQRAGLWASLWPDEGIVDTDIPLIGYVGLVVRRILRADTCRGRSATQQGHHRPRHHPEQGANR